MTEPDIKALLGKAVEGEPPLRIDRDEVFRTGRRKLRNRRFLEAGGAVGAVVVVVVGAFALSGVSGDGAEEVPPATSPTAPTTTVTTSPGLDLPLPPSSTTTSDQPAPPSAGGDHTQALTDAFTTANPLPEDVGMREVGDLPTGQLFVHDGEVYRMTVDLVGADREGSLEVEVAPAPPDAQAAACSDYEPANSTCETTVVDGVSVVMVFEKFDDGEKRTTVFAVRRDGTKVTAIATNLSSKDRANTTAPAGYPLADKSTLARIVTLSGLVHG